MLRRSGRRTKYDIYAEILEVVRRLEPCSLTRASYGARLPVDRAKKVIEKLVSAGLLHEELINDKKRYRITGRGLEFLEVYWKMREFMVILEG
ncbi:MAG: winged helix-turn-helix domain-containing protein [Candidatus Baldrarchaeota archaeon]